MITPVGTNSQVGLIARSVRSQQAEKSPQPTTLISTPSNDKNQDQQDRTIVSRLKQLLGGAFSPDSAGSDRKLTASGGAPGTANDGGLIRPFSPDAKGETNSTGLVKRSEDDDDPQVRQSRLVGARADSTNVLLGRAGTDAPGGPLSPGGIITPATYDGVGRPTTNPQAGLLLNILG